MLLSPERHISHSRVLGQQVQHLVGRVSLEPCMKLGRQDVVEVRGCCQAPVHWGKGVSTMS